MPSFKNKNLKTGGADQDPQDAAAIPGELDRQLQSAAAEITRDAARALGLRGWVKNMPDGSVELEAEGPEEKISQLVIWLNQGPQYARVEKVEVKEIPATGKETDFHVDF